MFTASKSIKQTFIFLITLYKNTYYIYTEYLYYIACILIFRKLIIKFDYKFHSNFHFQTKIKLKLNWTIMAIKGYYICI